jgi:hypothetical protein
MSFKFGLGADYMAFTSQKSPGTLSSTIPTDSHKQPEPHGAVDTPLSGTLSQPPPDHLKSRKTTLHAPFEKRIPQQEPNENQFENQFFQLTPSRKITDEQLYQEFKRDYMIERVTLALKKCRRFQVPLKRMGAMNKGMKLKKFPKKIGCRFEASKK